MRGLGGSESNRQWTSSTGKLTVHAEVPPLGLFRWPIRDCMLLSAVPGWQGWQGWEGWGKVRHHRLQLRETMSLPHSDDAMRGLPPLAFYRGRVVRTNSPRYRHGMTIESRCRPKATSSGSLHPVDFASAEVSSPIYYAGANKPPVGVAHRHRPVMCPAGDLADAIAKGPRGGYCQTGFPCCPTSHEPAKSQLLAIPSRHLLRQSLLGFAG